MSDTAPQFTYYPYHPYFSIAVNLSLPKNHGPSNSQIPQTADAQSPLTKPNTRINFFFYKIFFQPHWSCQANPSGCCEDYTCRCNLFGTNCRYFFLFSIHFIKNIYVSVKRENEIFKLIVSSTNPSINQNSNNNKRGKYVISSKCPDKLKLLPRSF